MNRLVSLSILLLCLLGAYSQDAFTDLYSRGLELMDAHDYVAAIEAFDKAYEAAPVKSRERSKAVWAKGMALYITAQRLRLDEDYEGAYKKYGDAMTCFRHVSRDKNVMDCAVSMAVLNANHFGFKDLATEQYEYAFDLAKGMDSVANQAEILLELINIQRSLHNEKEVARYNSRLDSLISANSSLSGNSNLLFDEGNRAFQNGDWDVAVSWYQKFLATDPKDAKCFSVLQKLRDSHARLGDDVKALTYSEECVEDWKKTFKNDPTQKYVGYRNHFPFQIKVGDYEGALASIDSLQKSTSATGTDLAGGELLMDRARVYSKMDRWAEAVRDFKVADSLLARSHQTVAVRNKMESLVPLYAGALYQNGQLEDSYRQYLRYLDLMKCLYGEKSMEYSNALCYLANIEGFINKLDDGTRHYIRSWEIARDITAQDLQFLPANARGHYWSETSSLMWNMMPYGIAANCQEDDFTAAAFEALMFSKGLLLSTEKSTGKQVRDSGDVDLISDFMAVADLRNEIEALKADCKGDEIMGVYARMDSLDRALPRKLILHGISPVVSTPSASDIAMKLEKDDVLVDFTDYVKNDGTHVYAAFILRKGMQSPRLVKIFAQSALDSLIVLNNGRYSHLYDDNNCDELYDIILRPLAPEIRDARRLYFVPSGILNQIAIEAMKTPEGQIMGEKYDAVRLTNSKEVLTYKDNGGIRNFETARLYGGLDYDVDSETMASSAKESDVSPLLSIRGNTSGMKAYAGFKKLKMSEAEVTGIDKILSRHNIKTEIMMNEHGTEESFVGMSGKSPDLLLISTHGFYYSPDNVPSWSSLNGYDNPMYLTGLVMSGGNAEYLKKPVPDGVMGGLLTSSDIAQLDLGNSQLVILSACNTGLGDTTNEGVYGLQRAFKKAGAQTLVMSLWPVSDIATNDFMILFHEQLAANGWDKRKAFRSAKNAIRQKYKDPFYWASFIMVD